METWFNTPERIDALEAAALSWVGTPFVANSRVKGKRGGTCCHMLAEQIYLEAGHTLPFQAPSASMKWSDISKVSLIEKFFDTQTDLFQTLENLRTSAKSADKTLPSPDPCLLTPVSLPGDVVGFRIGGCIHHVGIALSGGRFVHCMRGMGTKIFNLNDPTYAPRIEKIWRPRP